MMCSGAPLSDHWENVSRDPAASGRWAGAEMLMGEPDSRFKVTGVVYSRPPIVRGRPVGFEVNVMGKIAGTETFRIR